jgi:hypothetical protein
MCTAPRNFARRLPPAVRRVVSYVQGHYNVSGKVADRAFAALSAGRARANTLLFDHTSELGHDSVMNNAAGIAPCLTGHQVASATAVLGFGSAATPKTRSAPTPPTNRPH